MMIKSINRCLFNLHLTRRNFFILFISFLLILPNIIHAIDDRGVWAHPWDAGKSESSISSFVQRLHNAQVNHLMMMVKSSTGRIYWPSDQFSGAIQPGYKEIDFPALLISQCRKYGIQFHAWFCNFAESPDSYAVRSNPKWTMRNPQGKSTHSEILRGSAYRITWMCPARRPGYADQFLIPLMVDFAQRYDVDFIHHDYVRYPGDVAPDQYCYCDYCIEEIPKYAGYFWHPFPEEEFLPKMDRPHLEAHWEPSPRVLPQNWQKMSREEKSGFLLEGSFFSKGRDDLDYFFYRYRIEAIAKFIQESHDAVHKIKPEVQFSAAVFRNPIQAGRFIGQDWRAFSPWVKILMPMNYRSHFPREQAVYESLLQETILWQKQWLSSNQELWPGISCGQIAPEHFIPTLKKAQAAGVDGLAIFSAGSLSRNQLWKELGAFFTTNQ